MPLLTQLMLPGGRLTRALEFMILWIYSLESLVLSFSNCAAWATTLVFLYLDFSLLLHARSLQFVSNNL